jgi:TPP-dependent pyruvate/acetoin dehydrogenase alpha subunit
MGLSSMQTETRNVAATPHDARVGPPTRPERRALLRALLLGRGLERVLTDLVPARAPSLPPDAVLTAIAAASALGNGDRLILPHCMLAARFAAGADASALAAARLGERSPEARALRPGVGPQSPAALGVGVAVALGTREDHGAAVAVIERRWAEADECRGALFLAREQRLPLVVVAVETSDDLPHEPTTVDWRDFEAVRSAVRAAIAGAHADRGPALVFCSPARGDTTGRTPFRREPVDPVAAYERRLMINGFSRAELDGLRREVAGDLDDALSGRTRIGRSVGR